MGTERKEEDIPAEVTGAMIEAGAMVLDEFVEPESGLTNSPIYVVELVYQAMEKVRLESRAKIQGAER
jgi:hypothetical protein